MKQNNNLEMMISLLDQRNIKLAAGQKIQFEKYRQLLKRWASRSNLISIKDIDFIVERHFAPCAFLGENLPGGGTGTLIDVGTGAGLPGIILKILYPGLNTVLIDSSRKKCLFLKEVVSELSLNIEIVNARIENCIEDNQDAYDVVVNRAVAKLPVLWRWAEPLLKKSGVMSSLKGADVKDEIGGLSGGGVRVSVVVPDEKWIKNMPYIGQKRIVNVERIIEV